MTALPLLRKSDHGCSHRSGACPHDRDALEPSKQDKFAPKLLGGRMPPGRCRFHSRVFSGSGRRGMGPGGQGGGREARFRRPTANLPFAARILQSADASSANHPDGGNQRSGGRWEVECACGSWTQELRGFNPGTPHASPSVRRAPGRRAMASGFSVRGGTRPSR